MSEVKTVVEKTDRTKEIEMVNNLTEFLNILLSSFALQEYDNIINIMEILKQSKKIKLTNFERKLDEFI